MCKSPSTWDDESGGDGDRMGLDKRKNRTGNLQPSTKNQEPRTLETMSRLTKLVEARQERPAGPQDWERVT